MKQSKIKEQLESYLKNEGSVTILTDGEYFNYKSEIEIHEGAVEFWDNVLRIEDSQAIYHIRYETIVGWYVRYERDLSDLDVESILKDSNEVFDESVELEDFYDDLFSEGVNLTCNESFKLQDNIHVVSQKDDDEKWECIICGDKGSDEWIEEHMKKEHKDDIFDEEYPRYVRKV